MRDSTPCRELAGGASRRGEPQNTREPPTLQAVGLRERAAERCEDAGGADLVCRYGWVDQVRRLGGRTFPVVRDRSGAVQVVADRGGLAAAPVPPREASSASPAGLRPEPRAPGGVELRAERLDVLAEPAQPPSRPSTVSSSTPHWRSS